MKKMTVLTPFLALLMGGCATMTAQHGQINAELETMKGKPVLEIIQAWGMPDNRYETGEVEIMRYIRNYKRNGGGVVCGSTVVTTDRVKYDAVDLFIKNGILTEWRIDRKKTPLCP
jgi:hypothetical protein